MHALIGKYWNIGNLIPCVFPYALNFVTFTQVSFAYLLVLLCSVSDNPLMQKKKKKKKNPTLFCWTIAHRLQILI